MKLMIKKEYGPTMEKNMKLIVSLMILVSLTSFTGGSTVREKSTILRARLTKLETKSKLTSGKIGTAVCTKFIS